MAKKDQIKEARPQASPENREQQMIGLAVNLAEKQLRDGTASPSVINHYLKLGSTRENIEREMIEKQSKLLDAKVESIINASKGAQSNEELLEALRSYSPSK